uniref:ionotropic receptor 142 precursor n=1 Tax=Aedes aegypti TaxID=7159 RepID=UPI000C289933|nr:ionotropic receptor 142 precursor [Aedes aegypti]
MNPFALFVLLLLIFCRLYVASTLPPQDHLNYTVALIQHLARQQVGTFECVFMDLDLTKPFDGWLGELLATPALDHVVRFVINGSFEVTYENLPHKPSLIVVNVGNRIIQLKSRHCTIRRNFLFLDTNTRVLALVNVTCLDCLDTFTRMLNMWQFDKVVYMEYTRKAIFLMDYVGTITTILKHFPPPEDLFKSSSRFLQGRGIRFTSKGIPYSPYVIWVQETAKYVNTTAIYLPGVCTVSMTVFRCIEELISAREIDIALDKFGVIGLTARMYRMLACYEPTSEVILVPQSRPFNEIEMFVKPFAWEGWVVVISMLLLIEAMSIIFPALFKNDPILMLVCGFERYNLHEAKTREKIVFLPLIVFFFLMFNAYETKIISFMTNKPTIGKITTLDQLVRSGIKVKTNLRLNIRIMNDSVLGPLVIPMNANESLLKMDGINAYDSETTFASDMIHSLSNYDFKMHRPKYTLLDERRKNTVAMFYVGIISPLAEILYFTQRAFFETGLFNAWKDNASFQHNLQDRATHVNEDLEDVGMLLFDDLICTWIALGVGLITSMVFFVLELVFQFRGKF